MYVALLGALLIIMTPFILGPCYMHKPTFTKAFYVFVFLYSWYLIYVIAELFNLPYFMLIGAILATIPTVAFHYVKKSKKVALLNRIFAE